MPRFGDKFDGSSNVVINRHITEFGYEVDPDAIQLEIAGCQDKGFHGLIDCSRTDRLHFFLVLFPNHACNGAGNCSCP